MSLSHHQSTILQAILNGENIFVNAKSGVGKTFMFMQVAHELKKREKNILLLTYNRDVRKSNAKQITEKNLNNAEAHNYHTLARKYYDQNKADDSVIYEATQFYSEKIPKYHIIYVDECQDVTQLFLDFILHVYWNIYKYHKFLPQIVFSGDPSQLLYEDAMNVDRHSPFLTGDDRFAVYTLPVSYRVPNIITDFVNENANPNMLSLSAKNH